MAVDGNGVLQAFAATTGKSVWEQRYTDGKYQAVTGVAPVQAL